MATVPSPILDHIVILVPYDVLRNLPSWLAEAFTILQGGRHADGVTENKLILFQDGVYLELIAFIPGKEEERKSHNWGHRHQGHIIDWANTLHKEDDLAIIRDRVASAGTRIKYSAPKSGGRVRPDGQELRWVVSAPVIDDHSDNLSAFVGGEAPFWCLDRTPRDLRVPYEVEDNVKHPCGALGIAGLTVSVRGAQLFGSLKAVYDALQGQEGQKLETKGAGAANAYVWKLMVPEAKDGGIRKRMLTLARIDPEQTGRGPLDVYVELSLIGSSKGSVSGNLGDEEWPLEFSLKA